MRILHVITSLQTGGAETLVVNLMPRFRALGHEVGVVVFNAKRTPLMERLERECPDCKIYKLGRTYYNPWYIVRLWRIMREYDIVHTHNTSSQFFAAIAAKVLCSVVLVTTEHNTSNRRRDWRWYAVALDRWMYNQYRKVICISRQAEENLRKFLGHCTTDVVTIYNGVDVTDFHDAKPIPALREGSSRFVIVMVAGFRYQKDQDTLIRAMSHLDADKFELWLVGDGERRGELEGLVQNVRVSSQVRFLGLRDDVAEILHTADVVVMSSHFEGLSLSNIEGMSVGKPFVASDVDGLREMTEGTGLLFPHGDDKALADIISQLHEESQLYKEVADACYQKAQSFDIQKMVDSYLAVYKELKIQGKC